MHVLMTAALLCNLFVPPMQPSMRSLHAPVPSTPQIVQTGSNVQIILDRRNKKMAVKNTGHSAVAVLVCEEYDETRCLLRAPLLASGEEMDTYGVDLRPRRITAVVLTYSPELAHAKSDVVDSAGVNFLSKLDRNKISSTEEVDIVLGDPQPMMTP